MRYALFVSFLLTSLLGFSAQAEEPNQPTRQEAAEFYVKAVQYREQMLADYRKLLDEYFKLKVASQEPNKFPNIMFDLEQAKAFAGILSDESLKRFTSPHVAQVSEFDSAMFLEFEKALRANPNLQNNLFIQAMDRYGNGRPRGAANDVLQRVPGYIMELAAGSETTELPDSLKAIAHDVGALALFDGAAEFSSVSRNHGYTKHKNPYPSDKRRFFSDAAKQHEKAYAKELRALGFRRSHSSLKPQESAKIDNCPLAFANLR